MEDPSPSAASTEPEDHELAHSWCFWHHNGSGATAAEYNAALVRLCTFDTVKGFWGAFNNMKVSELSVRSSIHMMREGITPKWEDPHNANGGIWYMRIHKKQTVEAWRELLLTAIGETFDTDDDDSINGVTVSTRQYDDFVQVWTANAKASTERIFARIKKVLPKVNIKKPYYKANTAHDDFSKH